MAAVIPARPIPASPADPLRAQALDDLRFMDDPSWEPRVEELGLSVSERPVPDSPLRAQLAVIDVQAPFALGLRALTADLLPMLRRWSPLFYKGRVLRGSDAFNDTLHLVFHSAGAGVHPRDLVLQRSMTLMPDGAALFSYRSVESPLAPPHPRIVRARALRAAHELSLTPWGCRLRALWHLDPAGALPSFVVNHAAIQLSEQVHRRLKKLLFTLQNETRRFGEKRPRQVDYRG